jgi:hypothetical protein
VVSRKISLSDSGALSGSRTRYRLYAPREALEFLHFVGGSSAGASPPWQRVSIFATESEDAGFLARQPRAGMTEKCRAIMCLSFPRACLARVRNPDLFLRSSHRENRQALAGGDRRHPLGAERESIFNAHLADSCSMRTSRTR